MALSAVSGSPRFRRPGYMQPSRHETDFTLRRICSIAAFAVVTMVQFAAPPVWAQLSGVLGSGQNAGSNALGGLGGSLPSVTKAGPGNTAGVLQSCIQNNSERHRGRTHEERVAHPCTGLQPEQRLYGGEQ